MNYEAVIEAILFTMGESVEQSRIALALEISEQETEELLKKLQKHYEEADRGIRLICLEGNAWQMCTDSDFYPYLIKIAKQPRKRVLSDVLLETLSIIAYKQPVTKAEVEKIRGVNSDHAVNRLVEYGLCEELGRLDAPGRPVLFGTTEEFLRSFGVSSLEELPELSAEQMEQYRQEAEQEVKVEV
jgi:segregation and condensation protein B